MIKIFTKRQRKLETDMTTIKNNIVVEKPSIDIIKEESTKTDVVEKTTIKQAKKCKLTEKTTPELINSETPEVVVNQSEEKNNDTETL